MEQAPCDDSLLTFADLFTSSTVYSKSQLWDDQGSTVLHLPRFNRWGITGHFF